ncbi:MAG: hypothetical protein M0Z50_00975 [Planctomycetia bacterium]|jgi:hypothetical protein|nr:hypothetical protein [Planctomycetia bacterium]
MMNFLYGMNIVNAAGTHELAWGVEAEEIVVFLEVNSACIYAAHCLNLCNYRAPLQTEPGK